MCVFGGDICQTIEAVMGKCEKVKLRKTPSKFVFKKPTGTHFIGWFIGIFFSSKNNKYLLPLRVSKNWRFFAIGFRRSITFLKKNIKIENNTAESYFKKPQTETKFEFCRKYACSHKNLDCQGSSYLQKFPGFRRPIQTLSNHRLDPWRLIFGREW